MQKNIDVRSPAQLAEAFPIIASVIDVPQLREAFDAAEASAVRWKSVHYALGISSVLLACGSVLALLAVALLQRELALDTGALRLAALLMAGGGVVLQLLGSLFRVHRRWRQARERAERIRSIKFRVFELACLFPAGGELESRVGEYVQQALALLLLNPRGDELEPSRRQASVPLSSEKTADQVEQANVCFKILRLEWQIRHADARIATESQRSFQADLVAGTLFWFGAGLVVVEASGFVSEAWLTFLSFGVLAAFVLSAGCRMLAGGMQPHMEFARYARYRDRLLSQLTQWPSSVTAASLLEAMRRVESVVSTESDEFLEHSAYRTFAL